MLLYFLVKSQEFVRKNCTQYLKPGEYNCLLTTFDIFEMCMHEAVEENPDEYDKYLTMYFQAAFIFALIWGVAGILDAPSREKFDVFLRNVRQTTISNIFIQSIQLPFI